MNKYYVSGLVLVLLVAIGAYFYPGAVQSLGAVSPTGTTYGDSKFVAVSISLATPGAGATSTSILNTDGADRYITTTKVGCQSIGSSRTAYTGTGLANLLLTVGTTTTVNPVTIPTSPFLVVNAIPISTTTANFVLASSTLLTGSQNATLWGAGVALTFWFNATNTAQCSIGVDYFQG